MSLILFTFVAMRRANLSGLSLAISWELGLKQAAKKKKKDRGSSLIDGGGFFPSVAVEHTHANTHCGSLARERSWIITMCLSAAIDLAATLG